ncbi:DUF2279 domain-containing protein [Chitinophaga rhizosphaerae]|uniref:DUF2279 domain-containing protein n=1 Tax=Chitinophaga rhizosphaerae TaxID=1864947 RepID=UPI000F80984C|nr:DUF2279 domain-containing protein [Chitinophaga rhizosphaerae]
MRLQVVLLHLTFIFSYSAASAQQPERTGFFDIPDSTVPARVWGLGAGTAAVYTGSMLVLREYWYKGYPRAPFHFYNDAGEWLQMDKAGHVFTAYFFAKNSRELWRWTGLPRKQQIWIGGLSGFAYQSVIEVLDGSSRNWGFSWADMAANTAGSAAMIGQELLWNEQRIQFKFSWSPVKYPDPVLQRRANDIYGVNVLERILKDYNGQTYWASVNLSRFFPDSGLPKWLNISFGYGADGLYDAYENVWDVAEGHQADYSHIRRVRQFYLSADIDLTRIPTRRKGIKVLLQALNMIKIPAPALELTSAGRFRAHALQF